MELIKDTEPQKDMTRLHIFHQLLATGEELVVRGVANSHRHFPVTHGRSMWTWLQAVQRGPTFCFFVASSYCGLFPVCFPKTKGEEGVELEEDLKCRRSGRRWGNETIIRIHCMKIFKKEICPAMQPGLSCLCRYCLQLRVCHSSKDPEYLPSGDDLPDLFLADPLFPE